MIIEIILLAKFGNGAKNAAYLFSRHISNLKTTLKQIKHRGIVILTRSGAYLVRLLKKS